jgi:hypothetical protein
MPNVKEIGGQNLVKKFKEIRWRLNQCGPFSSYGIWIENTNPLKGSITTFNEQLSSYGIWIENTNPLKGSITTFNEQNNTWLRDWPIRWQSCHQIHIKWRKGNIGNAIEVDLKRPTWLLLMMKLHIIPGTSNWQFLSKYLITFERVSDSLHLHVSEFQVYRITV